MLWPPEHNGFLIEITRAQHPQQIIEDHQTDKEDADKSPIYTRRKEKNKYKKGGHRKREVGENNGWR